MYLFLANSPTPRIRSLDFELSDDQNVRNTVNADASNHSDMLAVAEQARGQGGFIAQEEQDSLV